MSFRKEFNYFCLKKLTKIDFQRSKLTSVVSEIDSCQLERKEFLATPHVQISSCRVRSLAFT